MDEILKRLLQEEADREADSIMAEVNSDPELQNVKTPDNVRENLFTQIREYEAEKAYENLSEEDKELIRLGKVYKKKRKLNKYVALVAILVLTMMFGITSMGGPEKILEVVNQIVNGRDRTSLDVDDGERLEEAGEVTEAEAYERIDEAFGFFPITLHYMPDKMEFKEVVIAKEVQSAHMIYKDQKGAVIAYYIYPNHRVGSTINDVEDKLLKEYTIVLEELEVELKHYKVEENGENRWFATFEYKDVCYLLQMFNLEENKVREIINNLYYS